MAMCSIALSTTPRSLAEHGPASDSRLSGTRQLPLHMEGGVSQRFGKLHRSRWLGRRRTREVGTRGEGFPAPGDQADMRSEDLQLRNPRQRRYRRTHLGAGQSRSAEAVDRPGGRRVRKAGQRIVDEGWHALSPRSRSDTRPEKILGRSSDPHATLSKRRPGVQPSLDRRRESVFPLALRGGTQAVAAQSNVRSRISST